MSHFFPFFTTDNEGKSITGSFDIAELFRYISSKTARLDRLDLFIHRTSFGIRHFYDIVSERLLDRLQRRYAQRKLLRRSFVLTERKFSAMEFDDKGAFLLINLDDLHSHPSFSFQFRVRFAVIIRDIEPGSFHESFIVLILLI